MLFLGLDPDGAYDSAVDLHSLQCDLYLWVIVKTAATLNCCTSLLELL